MAPTDELEAVKKEAVQILRYAGSLRNELRQQAGDEEKASGLSWKEIQNMKPRGRGEPDPGGSKEDAYEEGLRFWACAIARRLDGKQLNEMIYHAADAVPDFPGDAIRFFENRFEGLTLTDGSDVWP